MGKRSDRLKRAAAKYHDAVRASDPWEQIGSDWPPPRRWIVQYAIPAGAVTVLSGMGGDGKGLITVHLAAAVASGEGWRNGSILPGEKWPGKAHRLPKDPKPGTVGFLSYEDEKEELDRRFLSLPDIGIGTDARTACEDRLWIARMDKPLWKEGGPTDAWERTIPPMVERECRLLVVDPVANAFGGNENDRGEVTAFLNALADAVGKKCGVVVVSHPSVSNPIHSGVTAWRNAARSFFVLERHERK